MKKYIPNFITLMNLASGVIAVLFATQNQLEYAAYFVFLGIVFDFFDGFLARLLGTQSELGLQLDSLADMVTSGVVPGIVLFQLLLKSTSDWLTPDYMANLKNVNYLPFLGILISLGAAYRLANFNIDKNQGYDFIGLNTPAMTLFIVSLPLISIYGKYEWAMELVKDKYFLIVVAILGALLMNSKMHLFSLKFKNYSFKDNYIKYLFLLVSIILLIWLQVTAIPIIIILYIIFSLINNMIQKD